MLTPRVFSPMQACKENHNHPTSRNGIYKERKTLWPQQQCQNRLWTITFNFIAFSAEFYSALLLKILCFVLYNSVKFAKN